MTLSQNFPSENCPKSQTLTKAELLCLYLRARLAFFRIMSREQTHPDTSATRGVSSAPGTGSAAPALPTAPVAPISHPSSPTGISRFVLRDGVEVDRTTGNT